MNIRVGVTGLTICFGFLFLESCHKESSVAASYEITGRVYSGCPKQPAANKEVRIYMTQGASNGNSLIAGTITDNSGYFQLKASFYYEILVCDNQKVAMIKA